MQGYFRDPSMDPLVPGMQFWRQQESGSTCSEREREKFLQSSSCEDSTSLHCSRSICCNLHPPSPPKRAPEGWSQRSPNEYVYALPLVWLSRALKHAVNFQLVLKRYWFQACKHCRRWINFLRFQTEEVKKNKTEGSRTLETRQEICLLFCTLTQTSTPAFLKNYYSEPFNSFLYYKFSCLCTFSYKSMIAKLLKK